MILIILAIAVVFVFIIISFSYIKNLNRTSVEKVSDNSIQDKNIIDHYIKNLVTSDEIEILKKKIEALEEYITKDKDKDKNKTNNTQKNNEAEILDIDINENIIEDKDIESGIDESMQKQEKLKKKKKNI